MRDDPPAFCIRQASLNGLKHVEMIRDFLEGAVLGKTVEKVADGLFDRPGQLNSEPNDTAFRPVG
jgi:hypothetical protein